LFLCLAMLSGLLFSFGALAIEERAVQRYRRRRCLGRLALAAFVENFGYRQLNSCLRARAFWTLLRRREGWGEMVRTGYIVVPLHLVEQTNTAAATNPPQSDGSVCALARQRSGRSHGLLSHTPQGAGPCCLPCRAPCNLTKSASLGVSERAG
jgi:hypothetical protein